MSEVEINHELSDVRRRVEELKSQVESFNKVVADTNREQHTIKHDIANINAKFLSFINLHERGQNTLQEIKELIISLNVKEELGELKGFRKSLESITTLKDFSAIFERLDELEKFKLKMEQNIWWIAGICSVAGSLIMFFVTKILK